jgi:hypothetical protein
VTREDGHEETVGSLKMQTMSCMGIEKVMAAEDGHEESVGSLEMQSTSCMGIEKFTAEDEGTLLIPETVGQKAVEKLNQLPFFCSGRSGGPLGWIVPWMLQPDESAGLMNSLGSSSPHQASSDMDYPPRRVAGLQLVTFDPTNLISSIAEGGNH